VNNKRYDRFAWKCLFASAAVAMTFGLTLPADAEDLKPVGQFGYFAVGKAYEIDKDHLYWVGEFSGIFFSDKGKDGLFDRAGVKCPGFNDLNLGGKKGHAAGYCITTDAAGDQTYATWKCEGDTVSCAGTFDYTGGTGKYKGIAGGNTFTAVTAVQWKDGTVSGYASWNR
jgi:hypothetical protein